jgi:hypothetical protein
MPVDMTEELRAIQGKLREAVATRELLHVRYSHGSRPGEERPLVVKQILDEGAAFVVTEDGFPEEKKYVTHRILTVTDASGACWKNSHQIQAFAGFSEARAERSDHLTNVFLGLGSSASGSGTVILRHLPGKRNGRAHDFYLLSRRTSDGEQRRAIVDGCDRDSAQRICDAVNYVAAHGAREVWNILPALLKAKFWWPVFQFYVRDLHTEGICLRGHSPRLREESWAHVPGGLPDSAAYYARARQYDASRLRPLRVEIEGKFLDRVRLFEALLPNPESMFRLADQLSPAALTRYLLATSDKNQLTSLGEFNGTEFQQLNKVGLIVKAAEAPIDVLLSRVKQTALTDPIKQLGRSKPIARSRIAYRDFYAAQPDGELERLFRSSHHLDALYVLLPPAGLSWDDLQDFRCVFIEMSHALVAWLGGEDLGEELNRRLMALH